MNRRLSLRAIAWLPLASLVVVELAVRRYSGWGAWATAPLFLVPLLLSTALGSVAIAECSRELRRRELRGATLLWTGVALLPWAWLLVRRRLL